MKLKSIVQSGDPEHIAGGFEFTEGPVWVPEGFLLFSDIPANKIYRWSPGDGVSTYLEPSGNANGLTLDLLGRIVMCQHGTRTVSRLEKDGSQTLLADRFQDHPLNSPNDVVIASDGSIYFTDPPYGIEPDQIEQPCNGVYRINPDRSINIIRDNFSRPNGLALNYDESILYVDDSQHRHVRALVLDPAANPTDDRIVADMDHPQPGSPDGMKIDSEGNLFVTGATGVWVFSRDNERLGVIVTPEKPSNCAWGDADRQSLYITARTSVYRIRVFIPGLPDIRNP
ncbi:MAG: SMP-30/gluconolactonase/LRE family protein [Anaerolineales bacterium]|nr:SMP-30/gluconolactonase/LRE family protein [Anaerolineales bacterium]